jgi:hypothetical protein
MTTSGAHDGAGKPSSLAEERIAEAEKCAKALTKEPSLYPNEDVRAAKTTLALLSERAEMLRMLDACSKWVEYAAAHFNSIDARNLSDNIIDFLATRTAGKETR